MTRKEQVAFHRGTALSPVSLGLLIIIILPPALYVVIAASSMSIGVTAASLLWYVIAIASLLRFKHADSRWLVLAFSVAVIIIAHAALSDLLTQMVDFQRLALSLLMLLIDLIAAGLAARCIEKTNPASLIRAANAGLVFLSVIGVASLLGAPAIGPQHSEKSIVTFAEPSHYGLAYLPLLLFRVATCSRKHQIMLLGFSVVLGAALQSLTIIAGVFLIACVLLQSIPLIFLMLCAGAGALALDLTYYISRLTFSSDSENLSTLVFLQGWDNAQINFRETNGFGVGFQQFGIAGSTGEIAERISELIGDSISLRDGGSTATKLVGEFGALGLVLILALVMKMAAAALYIRRVQRTPAATRDTTTLLFASVIVSYLVELFMRGTGYFSPGGFLLVAGIIGLSGRTLHPTRSAKPRSSTQQAYG